MSGANLEGAGLILAQRGGANLKGARMPAGNQLGTSGISIHEPHPSPAHVVD